MIVKFKKLHPDAVEPAYAKEGDAALDLTATSDAIPVSEGMLSYNTGLAFEIPDGFVGLLFPRSSVTNTKLSLGNSVGVLDAGYRGEVTFRFRTHAPYEWPRYRKGDRIGQLLIIPRPLITMVEVDSLGTTERGSGGYGSSGF